MLEVIQTVLLLFLSFVALRRMIRVAKRKNKMMRRSIPAIGGRGKMEPITQERKNELAASINAYFFDNTDVRLKSKMYLDSWFSYGDTVSSLVDSLQPSINKLLKFYAERLNNAVRVDEEFMKKMSGIKLSEIKDSYSETDVKNLVSQIRRQLEDVREAKKKFWSLHDTARDLGFETWGDVGYKTYIYLKPE